MLHTEEDRAHIIESTRRTIKKQPRYVKPNPSAYMAEALFRRERNIKSVLDVGCRVGKDSRYLASKGYDVTGIDICSQSLVKAQGLWGDTNPIFCYGDMCNLPFSDESFDAIYACRSYEMLQGSPDRIVAADEFLRVLRPGGRMVQIVFSTTDERYARNDRQRRVMCVNGLAVPFHFFEEDEIRLLFERFTIDNLFEAEEEIGIDNPFTTMNWYAIMTKP